MKISKQERIVIIVLLVAAILGVGIFMIILPNFNNIDVNNKNLASAKTQLSELQAKLEAGQDIDERIKTAYNEAKNLADTFNEDLTPQRADEIMRMYLAKAKDVKIDGLNITPFGTETLQITTFTPTEVTYPLKDFANTVVTTEMEQVDVSKMNERERIMYAKKLISSLLAVSEPVTVGSISVTFNATSDKLENLHNLADLLNTGIYDDKLLGTNGKPQRKATYCENVTFELAEKSDAAASAPGQTPEGTDPAKNEEYTMSFTVKLFCVKPVDAPFQDSAE